MLSVVLATHNEEKNLSACLASIQDIAKEIIVVDGESTDQTVTIAKQFKAQVISTTNKSNFHINKQMAIDAASCELILQLDADEVVDEELKNFIKQLMKQTPDPKVGAWWIKRKNFFCGRLLSKGGQYPDPVIRLFYKDRARLPQKDVHEQMQVDGEVYQAVGHLLHYSNPTFSDYYRKFQTYTTFKSLQLKENKLKINPISFVEFMIIKPLVTFILIYGRHKGFVDGWQGLVFALFSALHHPVAYVKLIKKK